MPDRQIYEWRESPGCGLQDIVSEGLTCSEWVLQVSSFAFHGRNGFYTMCKERKQRGEGYWYAYVRIKGKLTKRYGGRDIDMTFARLEQVACELWQDKPDMQRQKNTVLVNQDSNRYSSSDLPSELLLASKLSVPVPRRHLVHRLRLIERLEEGMERALTLISAPVGFGKSTLLSDWITSHAIRVAWLSLEARDNEPVRFISYLFAALQVDTFHLDVTMQTALHPLLLEAILTRLINDLLRRTTVQDRFVLVLDNYQVITDESIHRALSFLLVHLPPWMHLVLATREDPPLHLAYLRGCDNLLELRAADLRFTQKEASIFLIDVMKLPLSQEESELLQARTEGWITGLQLAAFSLQGRDDLRAFIMAFSGSHHYVVDYLLEEVLKRQSAAVQDFLLQTCILDRLCAPLCDAVREQDGSQILLDYLERANLFLVALDDAGQWYRYHRLFAEALRQQLQQISPVLVAELYLRASHWHKQQGLYFEASSPQLEHPVLHADLLTDREHEVLQLLLNGASNLEIAQHLVLSRNTIKKHVLNICRKFDVRSRVQVIAKMRMFQHP